MKTPKVTIAILFAITFYQAKSQTNFLPGYYLKTKTDTIRGYIEYRSDARNSRVCVFKPTPDGKSVELYPDEIVGYCHFDRQWFESHQYTRKKDRTATGFFRVLVKGKLSLLEYESRYFAKVNDEIFEISITHKIEDGKARDDFSGLGLLKSLVSDCPEVANFDIKKTFHGRGYVVVVTRADYEDVVVRYNRCKGVSPQLEEQIRIIPKISVGFQISPVFTRLNMTSSSFSTNVSDFYLKAGFFGSLFIPRLNEKVRLFAEVSAAQFNGYSYFSAPFANNDLFVKYSFLELPLYLRIGKTLFLDLGLNNQFIINQNINWRVEQFYTGYVQTKIGKAAPLNSWNGGYLLGLGLQKKLFDRPIRCSARYNNVGASDQKYQSIELIVSYQLGKR